MSDTFDRFFRSAQPARDKYLARLFGFFSEAVVRAWCACAQASYTDLGRPTLCARGQTRGHTIDFTLRHRDSGRTCVAELKSELEYDGYRYLRLTGTDQLQHHTSVAFAKFLQIAADPMSLDVRVGGKPVKVDGAILIWGATAAQGRAAVMAAHGVADVLSVESMLADLHVWRPPEWVTFVGQHRLWTDELFDFLAGRGIPPTDSIPFVGPPGSGLT